MNSPAIEAFRFVHGKVCAIPGGPVAPGFEHRPTRISAGLPPALLPLCRPGQLLDNQSIQALVHPGRERDGAIWFWPAAADGQRYMLASCVRARPEAGEGGPGRTHTQLLTLVFPESVWNPAAPRLLAHATAWLRAEPDTQTDYARFAAGAPVPMERFDPAALPPPRCEQDPLPPPRTLLWRLLTALEDANARLLIGAADRIDSPDTFLTALSCVAALLPVPLRIYLSAAAGFSRPLGPFALQYLPDAAPLTAAAPGLFEQVAAGWQAARAASPLSVLDWQGCWAEQVGSRAEGDADGAGFGDELHRLLGDLAAAPGAAAIAPDRLRQHFAGACDQAIAARSVPALVTWLQGALPDCPARPALHQRATGAHWLSALIEQIHAAGADPPGALGRALWRLATLIDLPGTAPNAALQAQVDFWSRAWWQVAERGGRAALRWSALTASPLLDAAPQLADDRLVAWPLTKRRADRARPQAAAPRLGELRDFAELRALVTTVARARAESPATAELVAPILAAAAVKQRLRALRQHAPRLLIRWPASVLDLAAAQPGLLTPRADDAPAWVDAVQALVGTLLIATHLQQCTAAAALDRPPARASDRSPDLFAAAARVAAASSSLAHDRAAIVARIGADPKGHLQALLGAYWQWALAPDSDRDPESTVWRGGVIGLLRGLPPTRALRWLHRYAQPSYNAVIRGEADLTQAEHAATALFAACLDAIVPAAADPVAVAADLLVALPDLRALAPPAAAGIPSLALATACNRRLHAALVDPRAAPALLAERTVRVLTQRIGKSATGVGKNPIAAPVRVRVRIGNLAWVLLDRLLAAEVVPVAAVTDLFDWLDWLLAQGRSSEVQVLQAADRLGLSLAHCLLAWAGVDPSGCHLDERLTRHDRPIRRALARRLGFPRCAYFGGLTPPFERDRALASILGVGRGAVDRGLYQALEITMPTAETKRRVRCILGIGAARCWLRLWEGREPRYQLAGRNQLARLFGDRPGPWFQAPRAGGADAAPPAAATNEALAALAEVCGDGDAPPSVRAQIDASVCFTISFFALLVPDRCQAQPRPYRMPTAVAAALLGNSHAHDSDFAIHLGRLIAGSAFALAQPLAALIADPRANLLIAERILLFDRGWGQFPGGHDAERHAALLRLLYLLALVRTEEVIDTRRKCFPVDQLMRALQLAPAHPAARTAMAAWLERHQDLRAALRDAASRAGLNTMPGWPLA
ncbi:MAG: hypothetical protein EA400_15780 [Chromatiaceae bacterium]|nr:MAG: hypothetical protein EA400_15780 [Chromatiaceae bacterium]